MTWPGRYFLAQDISNQTCPKYAKAYGLYVYTARETFENGGDSVLATGRLVRAEKV